MDANPRPPAKKNVCRKEAGGEERKKIKSLEGYKKLESDEKKVENRPGRTGPFQFGPFKK